VSRSNDHLPAPASPYGGEAAWAQRELEEAHKTIRSLLRQLDKEQARYKEITRAYQLTVANLVATTRENNALERERDQWKARAQAAPVSLAIGEGALDLLPIEIGAIRKAMARLHHPDTGGDSERLKVWNATLDALEP